jgi:hypothetical protein
MVLGELLTSQFKWGPSSRSWGSNMGQLVTDSRFLTPSPYSSQVYSTGPKGSLPFSKEKPWTVCGQDLNMSQDAHGARVPRYRPLAGPSFSTPGFEGRPRVAIKLIGWPAFKLLGLHGP